MPFGPYKDHADCVAHHQDKEDPDAYCATVEREIMGKSENGDILTDLPGDAQTLWFAAFQANLKSNADASAAGKIAWATVYRRYEKGPTGGWTPLKVFIENAMFRQILKADRVIFGAASVAIKDSDNDLITEDALKRAFNSYIERGHVLFYHRNVPIGEVLPSFVAASGDKLVSEVRDGQLNVVVRIYRDTKIANEVWDGIERGALRAFSIGGEVIGDPVKVCEDAECKTWHKRIDQIDLHEISIVPEPANQAAYFGIVKSKVERMEPTESQKQEKPCGCKSLTGEDVTRIVSELLNARKAEHAGDCPEGHHMVDGKCVPMKEEEKSKSETKEKTNMSDETKNEPKAPEPNPLEVRIASLESGLGEIKSLLTKALEAKPAPEPAKEEKKETPKPDTPALRPKASVDTNVPENKVPSILNDEIKTELGQTVTWANSFAKAATFRGA